MRSTLGEMMDLDFNLGRFLKVLVLWGNLAVLIFVTNAYHRSGKKHPVLLWIAVAPALGILRFILDVVLDHYFYFRMEEMIPSALGIIWLIMGILEVIMWVLATCLLVRRYLILQPPAPGNGLEPIQEPNKSGEGTA